MKKTIQILFALLLLVSVGAVMAGAADVAPAEVVYSFDADAVFAQRAALDRFVQDAAAETLCKTEETETLQIVWTIAFDETAETTVFQKTFLYRERGTTQTITAALNKEQPFLTANYIFSETEASALRMMFPAQFSENCKWINGTTLQEILETTRLDYRADAPQFGIYQYVRPALYDAMAQWDQMLRESGAPQFYQLGFFALCPEHIWVLSGHEDPAHLTAGGDTYRCTKCFFARMDVIPAVGHTFTDWEITTPATCSAPGEKTRVCTVCGETETAVLPATGAHSFAIVRFKAGIRTEGGKEARCSVCGYLKSRRTFPGVANMRLAFSNGTAYDGTVKTPVVTVYDTAGNVIPAKNYRLKYSKGRKDVGTYAVRAVFIGSSYEGSILQKFNITPAPIVKLKAAAGDSGIIKLAWTPSAGAQRYVVYYNAAGDNTLHKAGTTAKRVFYVKGLQPGTLYRFSVLPVATVGGTNYRGGGATAKRIAK